MATDKDKALLEVNDQFNTCADFSNLHVVPQASAFRQYLISSGSAQQLTAYDSLHKNIGNLNDMLDKKFVYLPVPDSFITFLVLVFVFVPWLFGVFKMVMAVLT